jgi:hypothetical protein
VGVSEGSSVGEGSRVAVAATASAVGVAVASAGAAVGLGAGWVTSATAVAWPPNQISGASSNESRLVTRTIVIPPTRASAATMTIREVN